jgi:hypothetical protein
MICVALGLKAKISALLLVVMLTLQNFYSNFYWSEPNGACLEFGGCSYDQTECAAIDRIVVLLFRGWKSRERERERLSQLTIIRASSNTGCSSL